MAIYSLLGGHHHFDIIEIFSRAVITESSLIFFGKSQIEVALHNQQQS